MGNVLQAFGVFSRFRNEDRPGGFGLDSYLDDHSALFYKGKYFVLLYATESSPSALKQWATKIASKIVDPSPPPKEISYFPKNGLKPGSIQYFPEGLLGHQFLKRGFQGIYIEKEEVKVEAEDKNKKDTEDETKAKTENKEFKLFLAIYRDSQEAMSALKAYKEDLSKKGNVFSGSIIEFKALAVRGEDPYQGKVFVLQKGFYLLGVVGFEREEEGEDRLAEFVKNSKMVAPPIYWGRKDGIPFRLKPEPYPFPSSPDLPSSPFCFSIGSLIRKVDPFPTSLSTSISPLWL